MLYVCSMYVEWPNQHALSNFTLESQLLFLTQLPLLWWFILCISTCFFLTTVGCKVMIASRNAGRLKAAATELQKQLPEGSTAELEYTVCNIRQEEQVYIV